MPASPVSPTAPLAPLRASRSDYAFLLLLALCWGMSFLLIEYAIETLTPLALVTARVLMAAALLACVALVRGARWPTAPGTLLKLALVGWLGNALPFFLIGWGQQEITSGLAAIIMAIVPLTTMVLAHLTTRDDRMTPPKIAGVALGFIGVVILIGPEALAGLGLAFLSEGAVALGAVSYAVTAQIARRLPPVDHAAAGAIALFVGGVTVAAVLVARGDTSLMRVSGPSLAAAVALAMFPTALATLLYFRLVSRVGATFVSLNNYVVPVIGVLLGMVFLAERPTPEMGLALGLILAGIALARAPAGWFTRR